MKNKLQHLTVQNFMGVLRADMDLKAPVHFVVGGNAQGKAALWPPCVWFTPELVRSVVLGIKNMLHNY